jgi:hypothetical protein
MIRVGALPALPSASKLPHVASSTTAWERRAVRVISRMDCWAKTGAMEPPTAWSARTCPGVARPRRSPKPADVPGGSGRGSSHGRWRRTPRVWQVGGPEEWRAAVLAALAVEIRQQARPRGGRNDQQPGA